MWDRNHHWDRAEQIRLLLLSYKILSGTVLTHIYRGKVDLQENSKRSKSLLLRRYVRECVPYCPDIRLDYRYNRVHDQFQLFLCQHALPDAAQNGEMLLPLITHTKMYRSKHSYKFSSGF